MKGNNKKVQDKNQSCVCKRLAKEEHLYEIEKVKTIRSFHSICRKIEAINGITLDEKIEKDIDELNNLIEFSKDIEMYSDAYYYSIIKRLNSKIANKEINEDTAIYELISVIDPHLIIYKISSSNLENSKKVQMVREKFGFVDPNLLKYEKMYKSLKNKQSKKLTINL